MIITVKVNRGDKLLAQKYQQLKIISNLSVIMHKIGYFTIYVNINQGN